MSLLKYSTHKPSGVQWLGEVPKHWECVRFRRIFEIKKRIAGRLGYEIFSITQNGFRIRDPEDNDGQLSMDYSKYQLVNPGDFAMNPMDLISGGADVAISVGVTSPDYRVFSLRRPEKFSSKFLLYVINHCYRNGIFYPFGQGSSQLGRWRFPRQQFNDFSVSIPSYDEQTQIASFLDRETAKIDELIGEQRRLIELLKEKRQAVILHAVTKGLNPNAPLKPSGVKRLGKVPNHWTVTVIKRFATLQRGHDLTDSQRTEGPYPVVTSGGISGTHGSFIANGPGVVTGRYGSTGRLFFIESDYWPHNTSLYVKDFHGNKQRFVWYALQTVDFTAHSAKAAVPGIDRNDIHVLPAIVPPLEEQRQIVRFLDVEMENLDSLVTEAQRAIELLQERRTALISTAVTGKIDVRGLGGAAQNS